jgi:hypothetical protein
MPEISRFFGIVIRRCFHDHNPPHIHAEYRDGKAVLDLAGNITQGDLKSSTATKPVREWIDLGERELREDWELAQAGKGLKKIAPLE